MAAIFPGTNLSPSLKKLNLHFSDPGLTQRKRQREGEREGERECLCLQGCMINDVKNTGRLSLLQSSARAQEREG